VPVPAAARRQHERTVDYFKIDPNNGDQFWITKNGETYGSWFSTSHLLGFSKK